jgi:hypothetical protein
MTCGSVETLITIMKIVVAKEHTAKRSILELVSIVRSQIQPTSATGDPKCGVIRCGAKEMMKRCVIV